MAAVGGESQDANEGVSSSRVPVSADTGSIAAAFDASWFWGAWLFGPVSFGAAYVTWVVVPDLSGPWLTPTVGSALAVSHFGAAALTIPILLEFDRHWRRPELWVIVTYWVSLAGWLGLTLASPMVLNEAEIRFAELCILVSLAAVVLMPAISIVRLLAGWSRKRGRPSAAQ